MERVDRGLALGAGRREAGIGGIRLGEGLLALQDEPRVERVAAEFS